GVADAIGLVGSMLGRNMIGEGPICICFGVTADGEFLGAAGEIDEAGLGIEAASASVVADLDDGDFFGRRWRVNAENVDDSVVGGEDCVAFEPAVELTLEPGRIATDAVGADPALGFEQI